MNSPTVNALGLLLAVSLGMPEAPAQGEVLKPTLDVSDMRIIIFYISTGELLNLQERYGANVDRRDIRQSHRRGGECPPPAG